MLEHIVGIGLVSQKIGQFAAYVDNASANIPVVLTVALHTHGVACHIHLPAQFAVVGIGHEGIVTGEVEGEYPTLKAAFLGSDGCRLACRVGQTVKVFLVNDVQGIGFVGLEQVLRELQRQHAGLLSELAQSFLSLFIEQSTAAYKTVVAVVQQSFLLIGQAAVVPVHGLDALKQLAVEPHVVGMFRQYGLQLLGQCIHLVVGFCTQQIEEHGGYPRQQVVVAVVVVIGMDDGIVESGLVWIVDGLVHQFFVSAYAFHESLLIVFQANLVEGNTLVWSVIG